MDQTAYSPFLYPALAAASILIFTILNRPDTSLCSIPTVDRTGALTSWLGPLTFLVNSKGTLMSSAKRFPGSMYKIRRSPGWQVVVTDLSHVADIKKARDADLSLILAQNDLLAIRWLFDHEGKFGRISLTINQRLLSPRTVEASFDLLYDELLTQLPIAFPTSNEEGWSSACCFTHSMKLASPVINRFYVGKELCRNPEYLNMIHDMMMKTPAAGMLIGHFPGWLQPIVGPIISPLKGVIRRSKDVMGSYIQRRFEWHENRGPEEPLDMVVDWIIDESEEAERNVEFIALQIVRANFASLVSTSMLVASVLFQIGSSQEYATMLREEIEEVTREHGWNKHAMAKLDKLDSFIRETSRFKTSGLTLNRKVVNPDGFAFSDGTTLPYGTYVSAASFTIEHSPELYDNPEAFDPLRAYKMRQNLSDPNSTKYLASTPETNNLLFGLGLHACPGRLWVIFVVKLLIARFVVTYDLKLKDGVMPKDVWMSGFCFPNMTTPLLYRKRRN